MNTKALHLILGILLIASCSGPTPTATETQKTEQDVFFERFKPLEGKKFAGQQIFIDPSMESWADRELEIHFREVHHNIVYIPFRVGENRSRTWELHRLADGRLRLRHDHRHHDGTPEELTLYGGYTAAGSTDLQQFFPADDYTCNLKSAICDNEWSLSFSEDLQTLSYILRKAGRPVFQADFDIAQAIQ